ncbi:cilia- and flagella-associated protein 91 [Lasioglossum baleicum]|uniref:cilia- and flagella-associated protein 91 n=1 Tax=Lasioglossum baleicum TaxID=434251 RepID=UPI003FCD5F11
MVHGRKARYKMSSVQAACTITICENINIRDSSKYMRKYNKKTKDWILDCKIMTGHNTTEDIMCSYNFKYFRRPIIPFLVPKMQNVEIPKRFNHEILNDVVRNAQKQCYEFSLKSERHRNIGTQTDYRDSDTQTVPWEPPYRIKEGHDPEILTIAHLTWNQGLPPGAHELEVINRMRMKKKWEQVLPPMDTPANTKLRTAILTAIEVDEWAFREAEIQAIMDYRLELMDEITKSREAEKEQKTEGRFHRLKDILSKRRDEKIHSIRHNLRRELRKLQKKHYQKSRSTERDIIKEYADPSSEMYAPQMRYGEHPQRRHEVIQKKLLKDTIDEDLEKMSVLPKWLPTLEELKAIRPKPKPFDLCIRETRWTDEKLRQLYNDLKALRMNIEHTETSTLLKRKYKPPSLPPTPCKTHTEDVQDMHLHQLSTLIQKIVKGRAIQCMVIVSFDCDSTFVHKHILFLQMFEGRNRCRELIEELRSSHGLEEESKKQRQNEKQRVIELLHLQNEKSLKEDHLCEILDSLEGMSLSAMLNFLSKELLRLEDERRIHAFALLAERERAMREAAEAGRRQLERNRRREFDEMFRQIVKVHQDSVEIYLEDVIKEGVDWVSDEAAKQYINNLCNKVDSVAKHVHDNASRVAEEELVANMIYNFVLPEVEKHTVRKNIRMQQQSYLQHAHATIYSEIVRLPPVNSKDLPNDISDTKHDEISRELCVKTSSIVLSNTDNLVMNSYCFKYLFRITGS